jgi:hypothetical protein
MLLLIFMVSNPLGRGDRNLTLSYWLTAEFAATLAVLLSRTGTSL